VQGAAIVEVELKSAITEHREIAWQRRRATIPLEPHQCARRIGSRRGGGRGAGAERQQQRTHDPERPNTLASHFQFLVYRFSPRRGEKRYTIKIGNTMLPQAKGL
jgi:hypothetical protein